MCKSNISPEIYIHFHRKSDIIFMSASTLGSKLFSRPPYMAIFVSWFTYCQGILRELHSTIYSGRLNNIVMLSVSRQDFPFFHSFEISRETTRLSFFKRFDINAWYKNSVQSKLFYGYIYRISISNPLCIMHVDKFYNFFKER